MQVHFERRTGNERRQAEPASPAGIEEESQWNDASFGLECDENFDPYWEPLKGQDDD